MGCIGLDSSIHMKTVYKYEISPSLPEFYTYKDALIRKVGIQNDRVCIWLEVDTSKEQVYRIFHIAGTGHQLPENLIYLDTIFLDNGLVFHIYEATRDYT